MSTPETVQASQSSAQPSPSSPRSPTSPHGLVPASPTVSTPPTSLPSSPKTSSATHITQVQPHASFFRVTRPNEGAASRPRPSSFASASSAVQNRFIDAIHLTPLSRQLSITSASDGSSIAARRAPIGGKYSREPLLPIGVAPRGGAEAPPVDPAVSTTATGRVRGSLEKIFKRGVNADSPPASPSKSSMHKKSPLQAQFPNPDGDIPRSPPPVEDGYFNGQSPPPPPQPQHRSPAHSRRPSTKDFVSHPPPGSTPFMPYITSKTGRPQRNYEGYPSQNIFFMRGHLLTGGDTLIPFIASLVLVLGISGTWFATTCVWWWHSESPAVALVGAYMCLVTVASMLATALRDPGILPRNLDPDPPYPADSPSDGSPALPYPRDLRIGDNIVRVKYCVTCKTYRPPRSSHCKSCDNCVDGCDHHCQWVNNCVGRRNYTSFITFLVAASLTLVLATVTAALHLYILTRREHLTFHGALRAAPGSAVVFALGIIVVWPLFALMGYHVRLLLLNITTIEQVRNKVHATLVPGPAPPNPFSLGRWHRNVAYLLCRPAGYTWVDAAGVKMEDRRAINPGAYDDDECEA